MLQSIILRPNDHRETARGGPLVEQPD